MICQKRWNQFNTKSFGDLFFVAVLRQLQECTVYRQNKHTTLLISRVCFSAIKYNSLFHYSAFLLKDKSSSLKLRWWDLLLDRKQVKTCNTAVTSNILFLIFFPVIMYQLGAFPHRWPKMPCSMRRWAFCQKKVGYLNRGDEI